MGNTYAPKETDWDASVQRYRAAETKYFIYRSLNRQKEAAHALAERNMLMAFSPTDNVHEVDLPREDPWLIEWRAPGDSLDLDVFGVIANRLRYVHARGRIDPQTRAAVWKFWEPGTDPPLPTERYLPDEFGACDGALVKKLLVVSIQGPVNQSQYLKRLQALEDWFAVDSTYTSTASQLVIAKIREYRVCVPSSRGSPIENILRDSTAYSDYVKSIEDPAVVKFLRQNVRNNQESTINFQVQCQQPPPQWEYVHRAFSDLLADYKQHDPHNLPRIGAVRAKLAQAALICAPQPEDLDMFRKMALLSEECFDQLRSQLSVLPPAQAAVLKSALINSLTGNRQLLNRNIELCIDKYFKESGTRKAAFAAEIWNLVQKVKNRSLVDLVGLSSSTPRPLLEKIRSDNGLSSLYDEWTSHMQNLSEVRATEQGSDGITTTERARRKLRDQEARMRQHPVLDQVLALRRGDAVIVDTMHKEMQNLREPIHMVDWFTANKADLPNKLYIIVLSSGISKEAVVELFELQLGIARQVQTWIGEYLDAPNPVAKLSCPPAYTDLQRLRGLIYPLKNKIRPGHRVVLCPTTQWNIHRVPLHALDFSQEPLPTDMELSMRNAALPPPPPVAESKDDPIETIFGYRNGVIYVHSQSWFRLGIDMRTNSQPSALPRIVTSNTQCPELEQMGDTFEPIADSVTQISKETRVSPRIVRDIAASTAKLSSLLNTPPVTYPSVTRQRLLTELKDADLVYFFGHARNDESRDSALSAYLELASQKLTGMDILSDVRMSPGAHVTLLSCQGGVSYATQAQDEVLGLSPAFIYAGASSILAVLWDLRHEDAALWTRYFAEACKTAESAAAPPPATKNEEGQRTVENINLAALAAKAANDILENRGHENIAAWAGFVWYGFGDFPRSKIFPALASGP